MGKPKAFPCIKALNWQLYSNIENLILWARPETDGSASEFCVWECCSNGQLEYWDKNKRLKGFSRTKLE